MRLLEGGVFNTEALKYSVRRLNQLGYFKPLEGEGDRRPEDAGRDNKVDVRLKFEEQNRNQLTFGAGVSQFDGLLRPAGVPDLELPRPRRDLQRLGAAGRPREELSVAFTEPFLFDRPITAGVDIFIREIQLHRPVHPGVDWRERRLRLPGRRRSRAHVRELQLERSRSRTSIRSTRSRRALANNPFLADSLLHRRGRPAHDQQDRAELRLQHRRQPDLPDHRQALTLSLDLAGLGGNTKFYNPRAEGIWY